MDRPALNYLQITAFAQSENILAVDETGSVTEMILDGEVVRVGLAPRIATREDYLEWLGDRLPVIKEGI